MRTKIEIGLLMFPKYPALQYGTRWTGLPVLLSSSILPAGLFKRRTSPMFQYGLVRIRDKNGRSS